MTPMISALNQLIKKVDSDDIDAAVDESDEVSTRLYNLLSTQMKATKDRERRLWNKTKQYKLWDFYTPTGEKIDQPFTLKTILDIEAEPWYENIKGLLDEADSKQLISWGLYSTREESDDTIT